MGVIILHDNDHDRAVLYCTTTERPFGHGFHDDSAGAAAETFLRYMLEVTGVDPRKPTSAELDEHFSDWHRLTHCTHCDEQTDFIELESLPESPRTDDDDERTFSGEIGKGFTCLLCRCYNRYAALVPKPYALSAFRKLTRCATCGLDAVNFEETLALDDEALVEFGAVTTRRYCRDCVKLQPYRAKKRAAR